MTIDSPIYSANWYLPGKQKWIFNAHAIRPAKPTFEKHLQSINNYCKSQAVIYDNTNQTGGTLHHKPNNCNSWDCEECRKKKAYNLKSRIKAGIQKQSWRLLTLTVDPNQVSLQDSLNQVSRLWDIFSKSLKRRFPNFAYIKVLEFHASGYPHLHIILNEYIPQRLASALWSSRGGGKIVDIRAIKTTQIANYVSSYLSHKDKKHHARDYQFYDNSLRRFSFSRNFPIKPWQKTTVIHSSGIDWDCSRARFDDVVRIFYKSGTFFAVTKENEIKYINMHSDSETIRSNITLQTELGQPVKSGEDYIVYRWNGLNPWFPTSVLIIVPWNEFVWLKGSQITVLTI